jgi:hypothetical protein
LVTELGASDRRTLWYRFTGAGDGCWLALELLSDLVVIAARLGPATAPLSIAAVIYLLVALWPHCYCQLWPAVQVENIHSVQT